MSDTVISTDMRMAVIISTWPETIPVFLDYGMICVGCYMSEFDTLADALKVYGIPEHQIVHDLYHAIEIERSDNKD